MPRPELLDRAAPLLLLGLLTACRSEPAPAASEQSPAATPPGPATASPAAAGSPATAGSSRGEAAVALTWDETRPPAPSKEAFGLVIGQTPWAGVEAHAAKLGLTCSDASPAAVSRAAREARMAKMQAEAREKGAMPDIVSAASAARPSRYEAVTQMRYSCPDTPGARLPDLQRPGATGRLLFVLDSATHPLRHVSFQRTHDTQAQALADLLATVSAYRARLGEPQVVQQELPARAGEAHELPVLTQVVREWQFRDLRVKVAALRGTTGKVILYENVEVPAAVAMEPLAAQPAPAQPAPAAPAPPAR